MNAWLVIQWAGAFAAVLLVLCVLGITVLVVKAVWFELRPSKDDDAWRRLLAAYTRPKATGTTEELEQALHGCAVQVSPAGVEVHSKTVQSDDVPKGTFRVELHIPEVGR